MIKKFKLKKVQVIVLDIKLISTVIANKKVEYDEQYLFV